jgi:hypothetical protein
VSPQPSILSASSIPALEESTTPDSALAAAPSLPNKRVGRFVPCLQTSSLVVPKRDEELNHHVGFNW